MGVAMTTVDVENWDRRFEDLQAVDGITLTATKLAVPRIRPDSLLRTRLLQALDEGESRVLTLVCTPAGFGKTTLLAHWARQTEGPVAWVSLDPDDNDPARFWRHAAAALGGVSEAVSERILPQLADPGLGWNKAAVTALVNGLGTLPHEITLILDDYHVIQSPAIHDAVTYLLDHAPPHLHMVIATRSDPPLSVARLRARAQLAELRAADLRFTQEESVALLQEAWALDLSRDAIETLEERTEGWVVGLQFAALSLQGRSDPERFLAGFTGSHRYVLDYLSEEVLDRQPDETRDFLLYTSVLERLTSSLCDAVTGRSDGQEMLERLERQNLFLVALDDERQWYRFHHLFRDLLRARLKRSDPSIEAELHRRAATWSEQHELVDDAIRHALGAGDTGRAAGLVERHLGETLRRGESATLERWLTALPDSVVRSRPGLCVAKGMMAVHLGRLAEVERLLQHAELSFEEGSPSQGGEVPTDGGMVSDTRAAMALLRSEVASSRGDPAGTKELARSALGRLREEEGGARLWAHWLELNAAWMSGRMEEAERGFAQLLAEARVAADPHPLTTSCHSLGWVQQARGQLTAALRTYREGLWFATEGGRFLPFHAGEAHLGIAQVLYARNQLEEALHHITEAIELTRQMVEFQLPAFGLVTLARIRQALGEPDGALRAIDEACRLLPATEVVSMWSPAEVERARLLVLQGRHAEAARWTEERGLTGTDDISYPRERDYLVLARVLLARRDPAGALRILERLDALAESQGRTESLIEMRALRSVALQASGDHHGALEVLRGALSLAQPEGYIRTFLDEGPTMAALLRSLITARQRGRVSERPGGGEHLTRIIRAFGPKRGRDAEATPSRGGLIEPLTDRELEVLRFLAEGRRNREIADQLVVTVETVKKHVSHIFDKLGATSRTEAVARARDFGLVAQ
jgi:LuxR family transcriptional regulator, maltose regulon positive regulatory protein